MARRQAGNKIGAAWREKHQTASKAAYRKTRAPLPLRPLAAAGGSSIGRHRRRNAAGETAAAKAINQ
jgi:hypothetical protein